MAHKCHWPGCEVEVPPAMWGCKPHWFSLPKRLRDRIWATYRRGQEVTKRPSAEYVKAAQDVQAWIAEQIRCHRSRDAKRNEQRTGRLGGAESASLAEPEGEPRTATNDTQQALL